MERCSIDFYLFYSYINTNNKNIIMENINPMVAYDVVQLPSQGVHYVNGKKSLRVAYLTAADENILMSPNLLQSDSVIDELLKRKILDKELNIEELVDEDRQAILIFLRNTAFGTEYKIDLVDPITKQAFEGVVDLSILKTKDFKLVADANGEYEFFLNGSKKKITFKFLTNLQENELKLIKDSSKDTIAPLNTKRLEMMIKSVDGTRDQMAIYQFIQNLPIRDSQEFKKYVSENKPGLDLIVEVIAPSGEKVPVLVDFGVEFFRPFYGI
jgi:hypothetical protein